MSSGMGQVIILPRSRPKYTRPPVPLFSLPSIPWQITGNHWLSLPCIHPADGALHSIGMLHRGARAAVEFAGDARFADGTGEPLARPEIAIDGSPVDLGAGTLVWERALGWLPTFTGSLEKVVLRGTVFAPD